MAKRRFKGFHRWKQGNAFSYYGASRSTQVEERQKEKPIGFIRTPFDAVKRRLERERETAPLSDDRLQMLGAYNPSARTNYLKELHGKEFITRAAPIDRRHLYSYQRTIYARRVRAVIIKRRRMRGGR